MEQSELSDRRERLKAKPPDTFPLSETQTELITLLEEIKLVTGDNLKLHDTLQRLEDSLRTLNKPILTARNVTQLLGAAKNPNLQPFVLRLLMKRILPQPFDLLRRVVKTLACILNKNAATPEILARAYGPLVFSSTAGPAVSEDLEAAVRLMTILIQNHDYYFEDLYSSTAARLRPSIHFSSSLLAIQNQSDMATRSAKKSRSDQSPATQPLARNSPDRAALHQSQKKIRIPEAREVPGNSHSHTDLENRDLNAAKSPHDRLRQSLRAKMRVPGSRETLSGQTRGKTLAHDCAHPDRHSQHSPGSLQAESDARSGLEQAEELRGPSISSRSVCEILPGEKSSLDITPVRASNAADCQRVASKPANDSEAVSVQPHGQSDLEHDPQTESSQQILHEAPNVQLPSKATSVHDTVDVDKACLVAQNLRQDEAGTDSKTPALPMGKVDLAARQQAAGSVHVLPRAFRLRQAKNKGKATDHDSGRTIAQACKAGLKKILRVRRDKSKPATQQQSSAESGTLLVSRWEGVPTGHLSTAPRTPTSNLQPTSPIHGSATLTEAMTKEGRIMPTPFADNLVGKQASLQTPPGSAQLISAAFPAMQPEVLARIGSGAEASTSYSSPRQCSRALTEQAKPVARSLLGAQRSNTPLLRSRSTARAASRRGSSTAERAARRSGQPSTPPTRGKSVFDSTFGSTPSTPAEAYRPQIAGRLEDRLLAAASDAAACQGDTTSEEKELQVRPQNSSASPTQTQEALQSKDSAQPQPESALHASSSSNEQTSSIRLPPPGSGYLARGWQWLTSISPQAAKPSAYAPAHPQTYKGLGPEASSPKEPGSERLEDPSDEAPQGSSVGTGDTGQGAEQAAARAADQAAVSLGLRDADQGLKLLQRLESLRLSEAGSDEYFDAKESPASCGSPGGGQAAALRAALNMLAQHLAKGSRESLDLPSVRNTASDAQDEVVLPEGLSLEKLLEAGEEIFAKRAESSSPKESQAEEPSADALGLAQRIVSLIPSKAEQDIMKLNDSIPGTEASVPNKFSEAGKEVEKKLTKALPQKLPPPPPPPPPSKSKPGKGPKPPPPPPPLPSKPSKKPTAGKAAGSAQAGGPPPPPPAPPAKSAAKRLPASPAKEDKIAAVRPGNQLVIPASIPQSPGAGGQLKSPGFSKVAVSANQKRRLKQIHWDNFKEPPKNSIWQRPKPRVEFDLDQIAKLFQVVESKATRTLVKQKARMISFVDSKRANNISIALSGIRLPYTKIKHALQTMDLDWLDVTQLLGLLKATPEEYERKELVSYLKGEHPAHKGESDVNLLSPVERYFVEIMGIPRLKQRIECCIVTKTFAENVEMAEGMLEGLKSACHEVLESDDLARLLQAVLDLGNVLNSGTTRGGASGFKLGALLRLGDMKSSDKTTSALKYVLQQLEEQHGIDLSLFLARDMPSLKAASAIQMGTLSDYISELQRGLRVIEAEVSAASQPDDGDTAGFADKMKTFYSTRSEKLQQLKVSDAEARQELERLTSFLGERFDRKDPCCLLRTMQSVAELVQKSGTEIQAVRRQEEAENARKKL